MAFVDHLEALRWHLLRSALAVAIAAVVAFFNIEWIFNNIIMGPAHASFVSYRWMCNLGHAIGVEGLCLGDMNITFQVTELSGQFMMSFSVSAMMGLILAFPYIFWEVWRFIRPALSGKELKHARGMVFWSSLLFFVGVLFAYYILAPFTINFFANYQLSPLLKNDINISNYYGTMSDLVLGMGIVFELPIVVFFLSRLGILTPKLMRDKRRYAILIIFILSAVITPPDWFSIFLVAFPLTLLYELSIRIAARNIKIRAKKEAMEDMVGA